MTPALAFLLGALSSPVAIYWVAVVRGRARRDERRLDAALADLRVAMDEADSETLEMAAYVPVGIEIGGVVTNAPGGRC